MRSAAFNVAAQPLLALKKAYQPPFRLLFCPGLGSLKRDIIVNCLQYWALKRNISLETLVLFLIFKPKIYVLK